MIKKLIEELENLSNSSDDYVVDFETVIEKIANLKDPECINLLIPFLKDDDEFDEMLFSIVHTMEMFDDFTYTREIIKSVEILWKTSKRWSLIIHMRILNSPSTLAAYLQSISVVSDNQKKVIIEILNILVQKRPEFTTRSKQIFNTI